MWDFSTAAARLAALLAPPLCACCRGGCEPPEWICGGCRASLERLPLGAAPQDAFAAFAYDGPARAAVAALKFRHAPAIAGELAALMLPRLPAWVAAADVLVPVPAHPARG